MDRFKWRLVILLTVGLFCLSNALLFIASTLPQRIEAGQVTPIGILDVATAFAVVILSIIIYGKGVRSASLSTWQSSYAVVTVLPALVLVALWLLLGTINWLDVLLPGLAWRIYIFAQTLPAAIALWNDSQK